MRILSGELKGREIRFRPNPRLRPTADKVRKALFDTLREKADGARVLDLFSGTGALGFEALSGGAAHATFVESDANQCRAIRDNLRELGLEERADVLRADAVSAARSLAKRGETYDLIFVDPPYEKGLAQQAMEAVSEGGLMRAGALAVVECRAAEELPARIGALETARTRVYGDTKIVIYGTV
ncbi:MAG TPA: 16S rRNA (guanine(966)-N(2))-methyltransferase RsmD [Candidatus Eisenbacteria bacterium]|jgi:16S rRNA (guanine(966)-N(2))-methyltransferase RsmD|nr:16S rRNA (guanine(966)-N(2))-methyltransferase RsmD [Candidatus Eisenbacteria bacterium]